MYLFDANVLITASNTYYPLDRIPEYWDWIDHQAANGRIKLPIEIIEEVLAGSKKDDPLLEWVKDRKDVLWLKEEVDPTLVRKVVSNGYAPDLTDDELIEIGQDPFLVAYALAGPTERCVVTTEVGAPAKQRANRRIPDVCRSVGVVCQVPFEVYRTLGFRTAWKTTQS
ncbi:MAG: DUF4411 family protein [Acidobacteriota bacterium]|nr:DUF4411 family protein [Acidobacteriota bacterium]